VIKTTTTTTKTQGVPKPFYFGESEAYLKKHHRGSDN
jgi:hypothetical protein